MRSVESGPVIISGNTNPAQLSDSDVGPSLVFQGQGLIDPRQVQSIDAAPGSLVYGFYNTEMVSLLDFVPVAANASNIATITSGAVVPVGGTLGPIALTAPAASVSVSPNVPVTAFNTAKQSGNVVTAPVTIDFGFLSNVTTAAASAVLTLNAAADNKYFFKGQWLLIPGAGTSTTQPWTGQVLSISGASITLSTLAGQTISGTGRVGTLDPGGVSAWPWVKAGCVALMDPTQSSSRAVQIVSSSASDTSAFSVVLRGYDIYGNPMTESVALNGTTIAYGKKAWKHLVSYSITKSGGGTTSGNITIGTSNVFGLPLRSDFFEYITEYYAAAFISSNGSTNPLWTIADSTNPATTTSGDVRGTIQVGSLGGGTSTATAPNGSNRLAVFMSVPAYNAINANNLNSNTLTGVAQNAS
jgi:hypothetical protein